MLMQTYLEKQRKKSGGRNPGVKNKNRADLRAMINKELRGKHLLGQHDEFDAVAMMAIIAQRAFNSEDWGLALMAVREVAKYMWAPLQSVPPQPDDDTPKQVDFAAEAAR